MIGRNPIICRHAIFISRVMYDSDHWNKIADTIRKDKVINKHLENKFSSIPHTKTIAIFYRHTSSSSYKRSNHFFYSASVYSMRNTDLK